MNNIFVQCQNVSKSFDEGHIKALVGVNLEIQAGEYVAIMGPSGSGKSTLLNMIGALDQPDSGEIMVADHNLADQKDLAHFRAKTVGFVFQLHNLIPTLTALENVQIPMFEAHLSQRQRIRKAAELLEMVGLKQRFFSRPTQLSGGERQRVAIARSLANEPQMLIADEPTGSLDSKSAEQILKLVRQIQRERRTTVVIVTHDRKVAETADRIIEMLDGKIVN